MKQAVIGITFNEDRSKVLIVHRRDVDFWVLPGGGVDKNEEPEAAVIREVLEETGLHVKIRRKVAQYTPINRLSCLTIVYECEFISGIPTTTEESRAVEFCSIDRLPPNFFFISKEWLEDALKDEPKVINRPLLSASYANVIKYFLRSPIQVTRFFLSRLGFPINSN